MYLFVNGEFLQEEEVRVSPFDHGFLYGLGLFETFRTYQGHPFLLDDHFRRLQDSANEMNIELPFYNKKEVVSVIGKLLEINNLEDGYFRWNVSAGERGIGLSTSKYKKPSIIVYVKPLPENKPIHKSAKTLQTRRNSPEGAHRLKSHHYFNNILGKREIGNNPIEEGIFLDEKGFLSEGVVSNLFWMKSGILYTPDITCGCLNGVTRQFFLALAKKEGIPIQEGKFRLEEALTAEEVLVTNSIQEIVPLNRWDNVHFPGNEGEFFQWASEKYRKCTSYIWGKSELHEISM